MDCSEFALQLIKNYNNEFNRMKRAKARRMRICTDIEFIEEMKANGLNLYLYTDTKLRQYDRTRLRQYFSDIRTGKKLPVAFTSSQIKRRDVAEATRYLSSIVDRGALGGSMSAMYAEKLSELECLKQLPVFTKLGKKWRAMVDAYFEEKQAYEDRWAARCAIKAFNKMNTGTEIKFGNCRRKGGSMSYIRFVVIDGYHMPLKKFLENVQFEQVILAA